MENDLNMFKLEIEDDVNNFYKGSPIIECLEWWDHILVEISWIARKYGFWIQLGVRPIIQSQD